MLRVKGLVPDTRVGIWRDGEPIFEGRLNGQSILEVDKDMRGCEVLVKARQRGFLQVEETFMFPADVDLFTIHLTQEVDAALA